MYAVIKALPIGFLWIIDNSIIALVIELEIMSKLFVSPLIIQPIATKASNLFINREIETGISNAPGTIKILKFLYPNFNKDFFAIL